MLRLIALNSRYPLFKMSFLRPTIFTDRNHRFPESLQPNIGTEPRIRALLLSSTSFRIHNLSVPIIRRYMVQSICIKYHKDNKILQILKPCISCGISSTSPARSATVTCRCHVLLLSCPRVGEVLRVGEGPVDVGILSCLEES